jgi:hypothetical protein
MEEHQENRETGKEGARTETKRFRLESERERGDRNGTESHKTDTHTGPTERHEEHTTTWRNVRKETRACQDLYQYKHPKGIVAKDAQRHAEKKETNSTVRSSSLTQKMRMSQSVNPYTTILYNTCHRARTKEVHACNAYHGEESSINIAKRWCVLVFNSVCGVCVCV